MADGTTGQSANTDKTALVPVVLFDGSCPLCRREIAHYRGLVPSDRLQWIDIANDEARPDPLGVTREAAMARMHVRDTHGQWQTGAWAFAELWAHLPGYRWLARLLRGLHMLPLIDVGYRYFARWRLNRRCEKGQCAVPAKPTTRETDDIVSS